MRKPAKTRPAEEIRFAQDMMATLLASKNDLPLDTLNDIAHDCDTLCWVLSHSHPTVFEKKMIALKLYLESMPQEIADHDPDDKDRVN